MKSSPETIWGLLKWVSNTKNSEAPGPPKEKLTLSGNR